MLFSATRLISLAILASVASSSKTPQGITFAATSITTAAQNVVKTDFSDIFSSIISFSATYRKSPPRDLVERDAIVPLFFQLTFGPVNAASNAAGYMGFVLLDDYDLNACAQACNTRAYDNKTGPCIFFNIWQSTVNGTTSAVTCSLYNIFTDVSTATNTGQAGNIQISNSRGFSRITNLADGSFQDYTCVLSQQNTQCLAQPSQWWTRVFLQDYDYVLINNFEGHSGTSACAFTFQPPTDSSPAFGSTLTYTQPLNTTTGQKYIISFFYTMDLFSPLPNVHTGALFSVFWNNQNVLDVLQVGPGGFPLQYYNGQVEVTATGPSDTLFFKNGVSFEHDLYLDDIAIFEKWF